MKLRLSPFYRRLPYFKGKNRLGMWLFKSQMYRNTNESVKGTYGLNYNIINTSDSIGRELFLNGIYESKTLHLLMKLLSPGKIMIDAGANIGAISLPVAKVTKAVIYAFEPSRLILSTLQQNIVANKISNVFPFPLALSSASGEANFYESDKVHGWSGLVEIKSFKKYPVKTITLDSFCTLNEIKEIEVLKIDVQGWEYAVLKGAAQLLKAKAIHHIIFEVETWAEENAGLPAGASQQLLLSSGYELFTLDHEKLDRPLYSGTHILWAKPNKEETVIL